MKRQESPDETQLLATTTNPHQLLHDVIGKTPTHPTRADGIAVAVLDAFASDGAPLLSIPTLGLSRIRGRSISSLRPDQLGQSFACGFEGGDPMCPLILGAMLTASAAPPPSDADVMVDGERVVLTAVREIELRCGDAALILSADGRIQMRGTYITSHASATQRILGGSVNIN